MQDPGITLEDVATTFADVNVHVSQLNLSTTSLCASTPVLAPVLFLLPNGTGFLLEFESQINTTYVVQYCATLSGGFSTVHSVAGTGGWRQYPIGAPATETGFYRDLVIPDIRRVARTMQT